MKPIDHAEFLDRLHNLLAAAKQQTNGGDLRTVLQGQSCRSFAQVYGTQNRLMTCLATLAREKGDAAMADLLTALETALSDGSLDLSGTAKPVQRLLGYVYPVV